MILKKLKKKLIVTYLLIFVNSFIFSQENKNGTNIYFSPRITIGYTFGSGMNYGVDFIVNIYTVNEFNFGVDYSFYIVNTPTGTHRLKSINLMAENKMLSAKIGAGLVKRVWGLNKINKAKTGGFIIDISATSDPFRTPSLGVRSFVFRRSKWPFYNQPSYISVYTYYRTPEIYIYQPELGD